MANVSPSASPYAVPPIPAGSPPPTSAPPPLPPQLSAAPAPSQPKSSSSGSSSPPSPVPLAPPPGDSASPPPPQLVPSSPPPALPPSMPPTTPLPPPALPPFSPRSPVLLPITISPPSPPLQSDPLEVPPLSPPPPPRATENFPPPPPSTPPRSPQNSTPPLSQRSPPPPANPTKASPLPPPSDSPVSSAQPSRLSPPPTHSPSTSPSTAPPAPPPKQASPSPPPPASTSPQSPPSSILPDAGSPTLIRNSSEASSTVEKNSGIGTGGTLGIGIGIGIFILSFVGLVILCANRRRKKASKFSKGHIIPTSISISPASDSSVTKIPSSAPRVGSTSGSESLHSPDEPPGGYGSSRLWFTYDDLVKATNGFSAENLVGEGGFGSVYKGFLQDGREVAVKQLKVGAKQGEREFRAEVEIISRIHHRYLVSFVGYCIADNRKLLVYDYVPNNTLYFHLHGEGRPVLNWAARVKIAAGAARGLAYLHEDCHPRIIHRDIKPSNILLDHDFEARVSDFGLAKLALDAHTHITTRVMGTFGYMAPEYAISGKLTEKSDVYSFGVVLLELITGRKPVDTSDPLGDEGLVEWARPLLCRALDREEFEGLVDPRLEGNYVESEMLRMIEAAAACVRHLAAKRPRMGQIVRAFDSFLESDLTNVMRFGESEVLNSAQQSLEIQAFRRMQFRSQGSSTEYFSQATMTT